MRVPHIQSGARQGRRAVSSISDALPLVDCSTLNRFRRSHAQLCCFGCRATKLRLQLNDQTKLDIKMATTTARSCSCASCRLDRPFLLKVLLYCALTRLFDDVATDLNKFAICYLAILVACGRVRAATAAMNWRYSSARI